MITDYSDPISVEVVSDNGTIFKKGMGNKELKVLIYEKNANGESILLDDSVANSKYKFTWRKFDQSGEGTLISDSTSNVLTITPAMVSVTATFRVSVEENKESVAKTQAFYASTGFRSLINE